MTRFSFRKEYKDSSIPVDLQEPKEHGLRKAIREHIRPESDIGLKLKSFGRKVSLSLIRGRNSSNDGRDSWAMKNITTSERPIAARTKSMLSSREELLLVNRRIRDRLEMLPIVSEETEEAGCMGAGVNVLCERNDETSEVNHAPRRIKQRLPSKASRQVSLLPYRSSREEEHTSSSLDISAAGSSRQMTQTPSVNGHYGLGLNIGPIPNSTVTADLDVPGEVVYNPTPPLPRAEGPLSGDYPQKPQFSSQRGAKSSLNTIHDREASQDEDVSDITAPNFSNMHDGSDDTAPTEDNGIGSHRSHRSPPTKKPAFKEQSRLSRIRASFHTPESFNRLKNLSSSEVSSKRIQNHRWALRKSRPTHQQVLSEEDVSEHPCNVGPLETFTDQVHEESWHSTADQSFRPELNTGVNRQKEDIYQLSPIRSFSSLGLEFDNFEVSDGEKSKRKGSSGSQYRQGQQANGTDLEHVIRPRSGKSIRPLTSEHVYYDNNVSASDVSSSFAVSGSPPRTPQNRLTSNTLKMLQDIYMAYSQNASFETNDDSGIEMCDPKDLDEDAIRASKRRRRQAVCDGLSLSESSVSGRVDSHSIYTQKIIYHSTKNIARTRDWIGQHAESEGSGGDPQSFRISRILGTSDDMDYLFLFLDAFKKCLRPYSPLHLLQHAPYRYGAIHWQRILFQDAHRDQLEGKFRIASRTPLPQNTFNELYDHRRTEEMILRAKRSGQHEKTTQLVTQLEYSVWALDAFRFLQNGTLVLSPIQRALKQRQQKIMQGQRVEPFRVLDLGGAPVGDWAWAIAVEHEDFEVFTVTTHYQSGTPGIKGPQNHECFTLPFLWKLPFEDSSIDLISARTLHIYLHNRPMTSDGHDEYDLVLKECLRVLKPGGYIEYTLLDSDIRGLGPLGSGLSQQFTDLLKHKGYDPEASATFSDKLVKAGFNTPGEAKIFLHMGPRFKTPFFGTDMPEDKFYEVDETAKNPKQTMELNSITGMLGVHMWESWLLKIQTEIGKPLESRLDETRPVLLEKRDEGPTGWDVLMGWAKKPTPSKVNWAGDNCYS
ncbi:Methyltransferase type 11 [Ascosphaera apis ARSEF 7405]|uniref:Methyltransferase type 11 n=1 Tax=Ascosphaera apis ARSEF 7405 TaxID=392613 RepID=A0A167WHR6_9EURO|nr:Methyltransferase type 11 [Ascosphaera apis ARSEF 7405]